MPVSMRSAITPSASSLSSAVPSPFSLTIGEAGRKFPLVSVVVLLVPAYNLTMDTRYSRHRFLIDSTDCQDYHKNLTVEIRTRHTAICK